jgi:hypothetical protein
LLEDSSASREYLKRYGSKKHQIVITPKVRTKALKHVDKRIYNKVAYISHDSKVGVIIEDESLANYERILFEQLWQKYL